MNSQSKASSSQRTRRGTLAGSAVLLCLGLGACTVGPDYTGPKPIDQASFWPGKPAAVTRPAATPAASVAAPDPVDPNWWTLFSDPELTSLETRLAGGNLDLATDLERLGESRAQLGIARADELPTLGADGSYTRERPSAKGVLSLFSGGGGQSFASGGDMASGAGGAPGAFPTASTHSSIPPFNLWQYGFDASWELDLWGHARREVEAAKASAHEAEDAARNALVSAEAELARDYITLRAVQQQVAITQSELTAFKATLKLTRQRAAAGLTTSLDVANASAETSSAAASLPQLLAQQTQLLNAIGLLLGEQPGAIDGELATTGAIPPVPPVVPVGLASDLTRRRPDIRAAEQSLHAATADIGVAIADFFPKITLNGSIGLQALQAKDLGNWGARQYGLGPTISLPIFEGGRLRATLELRRAEQREAAITYRKTVLNALGEVSNALASYTQEQARRDQLQATVAADQEAVNLSKQRYRQGLSSFIDVLDAQRSELASEQQLTTSTANVSTDLVSLYKALGGGWEGAEQVASK